MFKERYMTRGFSDAANPDEGALWPTAFALKELPTFGRRAVNAGPLWAFL
jgi:hypothetical protein